MHRQFKDYDFELLLSQTQRNEESVDIRDPVGGEKNPLITDHLPQTEQEALVSRSLKKQGGNFEISFESCFMEEHLSAFKEMTKNFIELCCKNQQILDLTFQNNDLFGCSSQKAQVDIIKMDTLSPLQRRQFIKDLETQEKLSQFLEELAIHVPKEIFQEFMYLTFLAWEQHITIRKSGMSQNKLLEEAKKYSQQVSPKLYEFRINFLNFKKSVEGNLESEEKIEENFKEYLKFYFSTVFLIIEGYFQNPYCPLGNGKRQKNFYCFDDDEDLFISPISESSFGNPIKRMKFQ